MLASFARFLMSGAVNTALTYLAYLALLQVLPYALSYTLAYLLGVGLAYFLYRHFVFRTRGHRHAPLWVLLIYLLQYAAGLLLVYLWVDVMGAPAMFAPLFAIALTLPVVFLLNRRVFSPRCAPADPGRNAR